MSANILFISETTLKTRMGLSEAIDGKQLTAQIKVAQDLYVQSALGSPLFLRLQSGIDADNLDVNESTLLDSYVVDCLCWYTMSLLPMSLSYQFFAKGVLQKTAEESQAPSRADLELIASSYKQTAEFYKQRMIDYLRENYSLYSSYYNFTAGYDTIFPELKAYTCPIWLGNSYSDYKNISLSGSGNTDGASHRIEVTPTTGVSSFTIPGLSGSSVVLVAVRSGLVKGITTAATSNTGYLQIVGATCTLPTGDIVADGELFIFTYR